MSIFLTKHKRWVISNEINKIIPGYNSYGQKYDADMKFEKGIGQRFEDLLIKSITKDSNLTSPFYTEGELFEGYEKLSFTMPSIYLPLVGQGARLGEKRGDYQILVIQLHTPRYLPYCHHRNYDIKKYNSVNPEGELLDIFTEWVTTRIKETKKENALIQMNHSIPRLLNKFATTKQLLRSWPEMEVFLPDSGIKESMSQKKAKLVELTEDEHQQIAAINKEIFIRKLGASNGI